MPLSPTATQGAEHGRDIFSALKAFAALMVGHATTRLELLVIEVAQERSRLLAAGLTVFFVLPSTLFLGAFILLCFWETPYRLHAAGAIVLAFAVTAVISFMSLREKIRVVWRVLLPKALYWLASRRATHGSLR